LLVPLSLWLLLASVCGCRSQTAPDPARAAHPAPAAAPAVAHAADAPSDAHWSYSGATGPAHWGSLSPHYALCATGKRQSPVNIAGATPADLPNLVFAHKPVPLQIVNNGHTIQVNYAPGSAIVLDGVRYELTQFHFHAPSEHTIDDRQADAELHLVHKSAAGRLAVVGVLLAEGSHNPALDAIWARLPASPGPAVTYAESINASALLPPDQRTFRYDGSLTTPPGTEDVRWCLMTQPVGLSKQQLAEFTRIYYGNNRPVQPLNGRTVQRDVSN
jgi:carbonic anhydrase